MYFERTIEAAIRKINETFPVLIVTGPRQVGKTTLLSRMAEENRKIVSLDNPTIRAFAKRDPELFLQRYRPPVLAPVEKEPGEEDIFQGTAHLKTKIGTGAVICMPVDMIPIDEKNWYIPAWII